MIQPRIITKAPIVATSRRLSSITRQGSRAGLVRNTVGYESFTTFDASRAARRQHQLATMDDHQLRETRRLLVLSLQELAFTFPKYVLKTPQLSSLPSPAVIHEDQKKKKIATKDESPVEQTSQQEISDTKVKPARESKKRGKTSDKTFDKTSKKTSSLSMEDNRGGEATLWNALRREDVGTTAELFTTALQEGRALSNRVLARLFYVLAPSHPILAYDALKQYRKNEASPTNAEMKMYVMLCSSIGTLDPTVYSRQEATRFVRGLMKDLYTMEQKGKQELLPKMVAALATQRMVRLGVYSGEIYNHMVDNEYEMTMGWLRQLLSLSKYNRQEDLPFHDILVRLAEGEGHPHPLSVIQAIHNMFPFTDPNVMCPALRAVVSIQNQAQTINTSRMQNFQNFQLDLDCLESISAGAAHSGSSEMISLLWQVLEQCNYRPTEAIYENTIVALSASGDNLDHAFGAINAMKQEGYTVSRALLRSFSLALRSNKLVLDKGLDLLLSSEHLSLETLNAMMSCYAERGDVYDTLQILDIMERKGIEADLRTFSFAIEVLGKNIHRWGKNDNPALVQENLDHADRVLRIMESRRLLPSRDLLRNYVELLCVAGEIETANMVVDDLLLNADSVPICSKILYRVAMINASDGHFERARELASHVSDDIPILWKKIRSKEQRFERF